MNVLQTFRVRRIAIVVLLLVAAALIGSPWATCVAPPPFYRVVPAALRICTFGDLSLRSGYGLPGFTGPFWGNLVLGIIYLAAAVYAAVTKRSL